MLPATVLRGSCKRDSLKHRHQKATGSYATQALWRAVDGLRRVVAGGNSCAFQSCRVVQAQTNNPIAWSTGLRMRAPLAGRLHSAKRQMFQVSK